MILKMGVGQFIDCPDNELNGQWAIKLINCTINN